MENQIEENQKCKNCISRMKLVFEHYKRSVEEEKKYTSFVFSLGYVTLLTIFSVIHKNILIQPKCVFICLLFISMLLFIINEIWKMLLGIKTGKFQNDLWDKNYKGLISLDELELRKNEYFIKLYTDYHKFYYPLFIISLVFGLLAAISLFFECLYLIF